MRFGLLSCSKDVFQLKKKLKHIYNDDNNVDDDVDNDDGGAQTQCPLPVCSSSSGCTQSASLSKSYRKQKRNNSKVEESRVVTTADNQTVDQKAA